MSTEPSTDRPPLRDRLRAALSVAMKSRDRQAVTALRATLGAIDNAEAVDVGDHRAGSVESSAVGLGAAEVARRELTETDIEQIVRAEIADRHKVAEEYEALNRAEHADDLRAQARTLTELL
ncbi:hypothetical protein DFR70_105202 [Nocardia tenerifensis]|uniref:Yqey-like protein n=1 Tax=Nocardia tenerifensis TaxID=228006 RepID=A0A318K4I3_9NOCA|nr:hypothetical protein [Nocardia tenerifensis]PXX64020.1 hypothetical protein DFR70_105202 [Nocardia tenerifensis]